MSESKCEVQMIGGAQILIRCASAEGMGWQVICLACTVVERNSRSTDPHRPMIPVPEHAELCKKRPGAPVRNAATIQALRMPVPDQPA